MPFEFAVVAAFIVGLVSGFLMMRVYVFNGRAQPLGAQASKYVLVNMLGLAQTLVISSVLAKTILPSLGMESGVEALAHLIGVITPIITSYFAHKFMTFR